MTSSSVIYSTVTDRCPSRDIQSSMIENIGSACHTVVSTAMIIYSLSSVVKKVDEEKSSRSLSYNRSPAACVSEFHCGSHGLS